MRTQITCKFLIVLINMTPPILAPAKWAVCEAASVIAWQE